jgi:hypothetical protein
MAYATATEAVAHARYAGDSASPARETREIEGALESARRLNEIAAKAGARLGDMKQRLLGLAEPQSVGPKDGPRPISCETVELRNLMQSLEANLDRVHENITALERV